MREGRSGINFARPLIAVSILFANLLAGGFAQAVPRGLKTWTLEYSIDGGITTFHRAITLTKSGDLTVAYFEHRLTGHASPELMRKVEEFLEVAHEARPHRRNPDERVVSLTLTSPGATLKLEAPDPIAELLLDTMTATTTKALIGSWWESEWKLCHPAAQMTAQQMDPPVQSLVFRKDGRFSLTWRGGGAESPGRAGEQFIWVPDYSGRYSTSLDATSIHLTFENGIHPPRDFDGDGDFEIGDNELVLRNLWLGTYKSEEKTDICEMTFKRSSEVN